MSEDKFLCGNSVHRDIIARTEKAARAEVVREYEAKLAEAEKELADLKNVYRCSPEGLYTCGYVNDETMRADIAEKELTALRSRVNGVTEEKIERIIEKNSLWQHEHRYYEVKDTQKKAIAKAILTLLKEVKK